MLRNKRGRPPSAATQSVQPGEIDAGVVIFQNAIVTPAQFCQSVRADLAHADAVAPPAPRKDESCDTPIAIVAAIDYEKLLAQTESRAYASATNVSGAFAADHGQVDSSPRRAPNHHTQILYRSNTPHRSSQTRLHFAY